MNGVFILLALLPALASILFLIVVYRGLQSGVIYAKSQAYRRDQSPAFFWIMTIFYGIVSLGFGGVAVFLGIVALT